jgi:restriction system protein
LVQPIQQSPIKSNRVAPALFSGRSLASDTQFPFALTAAIFLLAVAWAKGNAPDFTLISPMTPQDYIAAVKTCPRVAWLSLYSGKFLWRGYATRLDGDKVEAVPDYVLKSKSTARSWAGWSTPVKLWAHGSNGVDPLFVQSVFLAKFPLKSNFAPITCVSNGKLRGLNWLFPRRIQDAAALEWLEEQLQRQRIKPDPHRESELNRLQDNLRRTEERMVAKKKAILSKRECAVHPQPVDYGLTYDDVHPGSASYGLNDGLKYKRGRRWFGTLGGWKFFLAIWLVTYAIALAAVSSNIGAVREFFNVSRPYRSRDLTLGGAIIVGFLVTLYVFVVLNWILEAVTNHKRKHPSPSLSAYQRALELHKAYKAAEQEAEQALQRRKRSYWEGLNGYEFERETAEVLKRYQFSPRLTPGSADGGVDIEVTRNGLKGVVQCKAHVACVGPHVVRDLYGVIHHCGASFGIIVSRGGFTRGAIDFARDKPILFLDTADLIAMQEGCDLLADAFAPRDANNASQQP